MALLRHPSLRILCALLAFLVIGDVIADGIHDASGMCSTTQSQSQDHDSCPACGCTIHTGSAMAMDAVVIVVPASQTAEVIFSTDDRPAASAPPAIDHPPQLA